MSLSRRLLSLALAAPLLALPAAGPTAPAAADAAGPGTVLAQQPTASDRVTWGVAPADGEAADGRISFRYELDPGDAVEDHLEVTNYSDRAVVFDLVGSDGVIGPDGAFDILPAGDEPQDTGAWIEIQETVEIETQSTAVVPFTLTVPEDALPGDHPGGIAASVNRVGEGEEGPLVGLDTRVGARIHLRVSGEVVPHIAVSDLTATYQPSWNPFQPGTLHLDYTALNDGNVRLGSTQTLSASGLFGVPAGVEGLVLAEQREILPRQETRVSTEVQGVWPLGQLSSTVSTQQVVVGEDVIDVPLTGSQAAVTVWAVPWPQLALLALAAGFVAWRLRLRKRRRLALERARAEGERQAALAAAGAPA